MRSNARTGKLLWRACNLVHRLRRSGQAVATHLFIGVVWYKTTTYSQAAKKNLHFSGPKKVAGIGSLAYESNSGHVLTVVSFVAGHYIATLNLRTSQPLKSLGPLNALAKAVAGNL